MEGRGFYYPVDIGVGEGGRLYVLGRSHEGDTRGIQVCIMDVESEFYGTFGSVGDGDGQFIWTTAVVVDSDGLVYVSDEHLNRISVFDGDGRFLRKWGTPGSGPGELDGPSGMALDSEGHIWIADHRNHRIQRFTRDGGFVTQFGSQGSGEGQLELPWGITVAPTGDLYVSDWGNDRIQQFTAEGDFVAAYGERGQGKGSFAGPQAWRSTRGGTSTWRTGATAGSSSSIQTEHSLHPQGGRPRCRRGPMTSWSRISRRETRGQCRTWSRTWNSWAAT